MMRREPMLRLPRIHGSSWGDQMASINLGVVGCIAASASSGGSAPTGVSIAENASTGQNNAFKTQNVDGIDIMDVGYSEWTSASNGILTYSVSASDMTDFDTANGVCIMDVYAYLRATGATSYSWSASVESSDITYGSAAVTGAGGGGQDGTSGGVGIRFVFQGISGRGGYLYAASGDYVSYKLTGTATNSNGSTSADLYLKYEFEG